ncbi:MAG: hypothetical protein C4567_06275 [Deltaproteobacteria bacterium]|nr:MAG: hypothetical protein C4567_06275 [Deltaproteobacteria bacterium]
MNPKDMTFSGVCPSLGTWGRGTVLNVMVLSSEPLEGNVIEPQFKNSIMTLASEAAVLVTEDPETMVIIFNDILQRISRVKYYRPPKPRPAAPRVTKRAVDKWTLAKLKKVANA